MGLPPIFIPIQLLFINLISDGFPNLALTIDPKRVDIMKEKPRPSGERFVNKWMATLIGFVSLIAGLITLASFIVVYKMSNDLVVARSMAFIMLGLNSLAYVFSVRVLMTPFWKNHLFENHWLVIAVLAGFALQVLPFATSPLRQFFGLSNLNLAYWSVAIGLSVFMFFVVEIFKFVYHLKVARK